MFYTQHVKNFTFATIRSSEPITAEFSRNVVDAYRLNQRLFGRVPSRKFDVIICNNTTEWRRNSKYGYLSRSIGAAIGKNLLIIKGLELLQREQPQMIDMTVKRKPNSMPAERWKRYIDEAKDYNKILMRQTKELPEVHKDVIKHEMNHVFWANFYGNFDPRWVFEGLAFTLEKVKYVSRKESIDYIAQNKANKVLTYRFNPKVFKMADLSYRYDLWKRFISFITKDDPKLMVKFMDRLSKNKTKANYNKLFKSIFGSTEHDAYKNFVAKSSLE